jgi:hypothetical protein
MAHEHDQQPELNVFADSHPALSVPSFPALAEAVTGTEGAGGGDAAGAMGHYAEELPVPDFHLAQPELLAQAVGPRRGANPHPRHAHGHGPSSNTLSTTQGVGINHATSGDPVRVGGRTLDPGSMNLSAELIGSLPGHAASNMSDLGMAGVPEAAAPGDTRQAPGDPITPVLMHALGLDTPAVYDTPAISSEPPLEGETNMQRNERIWNRTNPTD